MSRALCLPLAALAIAVGLLAGPGPAGAEAASGGLSNLRVTGGEDSWHGENAFQLDWDDPPAPIPAIASIEYLLRDPAGQALGGVVHLDADAERIQGLYIPPPYGSPATPSGVYTVEIWPMTAAGKGASLSAKLRFDDARPGMARPLAPQGWIRGGAEAMLKIEHPAGPLPMSGLRGYAVVVDHGSDESPCAGPDSCTESETDLHSGIDGDSISLGVLPEGTNVARVVAVSGAGMRSREVGRATLLVDGTEPTVTLSGAREGWSPGPVELTARATDSQSGMVPSGPAGPFTAIAIDAGAPTVAAGDSATATVFGEGVHRVSAYGRDAAGNVGDDGAASAPPRSFQVRIDETPPRISFSRAQDPSEPERIEAEVVDPLSGADPARGAIAVRPAGSAAPFVPIPTSASPGRLTTLWDSDAFPLGSYEFKATGYDLAGNSAASERRENGTRMVLSNPVKLPTAIELGFGSRRLIWHRCRHEHDGIHCRRETIAPFDRRPTSRSLAYGRGAPVSGRLVSASGEPVVGQTVALTESFAAGASTLRRTTTTETGPDGVFTAHLAPGPSRAIEVEYAGTRRLTRAVSRTLGLTVGTSIRLHASTANAAIGGAPVVFSGRLAHQDAAIPAEGRPVELQFRVAGSDWSEFRTVQTNAGGRFRYPYSFTDDDSRGVRFQFRAYAPAEPGWPYGPGASRPVTVTGR